jgi:hypothetical protein
MEVNDKLNNNTNEMNGTRFMWKTLSQDKKSRDKKFHYEKKTKYNYRMIEPDLVWACTKTTISAKSIKL